MKYFCKAQKHMETTYSEENTDAGEISLNWPSNHWNSSKDAITSLTHALVQACVTPNQLTFLDGKSTRDADVKLL